MMFSILVGYRVSEVLKKDQLTNGLLNYEWLTGMGDNKKKQYVLIYIYPTFMPNTTHGR